MARNNNFDQFDLFEEFDEIDGRIPQMRNRSKQKQRPRLKDKHDIIEETEVANAISEQADDRRTLDITYRASKTEAIWLTDSLGGLFEHQWFDDVLKIVKGGKEASVYMCKGNASTGRDLIAAKVYRPRMFRALRNDSVYREGRAMLDEDGLIIRREREMKAIRQGTRVGVRLTHQSWIMHEIKAMQALHDAGFDVPAVFANGDNALLMEYVGDADIAAPLLHDVQLESGEAEVLFDRVLHNVEGMLAMDIVHGDLSAFNILYWDGEISIIDFPQVVSANGNRSAYDIFVRDITRVCEFFQRHGVKRDPVRLARSMWLLRGHRTTPEADPHFLDPDNDEDLTYWRKYK